MRGTVPHAVRDLARPVTRAASLRMPPVCIGSLAPLGAPLCEHNRAKHVPMLGQNRQRSPRFVTAHATTVTRWGHVRQLLCVEFDKDGVRLLFDPKILRNGCVTKAWICPYLKFWAPYYLECMNPSDPRAARGAHHARDRDLRWRCPESNSDLDLMRYELILIENE